MDRGWPKGPRPRVTIPSGPECWRCAEPGLSLATGKGRVLRPVALVVEGHAIGSVLLCRACIEARTPLNPDPLTVEAA